MAITRDKKEKIVAKAKGAIEDSSSVVFVSFQGMSSNQEQKFRSEIRKAGFSYNVVKKNLLYRSFDSSNVEGNKLSFESEVAMVYGDSEDPTEIARTIKEIVVKNEYPIVILGGVYEKIYAKQDKMQEISDIPSLETLYSKLAYILKSPISRLAIGLNEIAKKKV